ncbi:MAG: YqgE/AlgH family protein [Alphaproteobacteria bacterium]|nr:YqgE/AlgH family protein [Alphaproteobacteria bacterium]
MRYRRVIGAAVAVAALVSLSAPSLGGEKGFVAPKHTPFLTGQLLVATQKLGDPRFAHTVIYMVDHDARGAMGLIVNRAYGIGPLAKLLEGFGIEHEDAAGTVRLHYGGPVAPARGFILHSTDYKGPGTRVVNKGVAITTKLEVLEAIAKGEGPKRSLFALGYAGWGPGQLEGEIARDDWVTAPADESLIFSDDLESSWDRAIKKAGVAL